jgi:uncharacterized protein (TIGR02246 family)
VNKDKEAIDRRRQAWIAAVSEGNIDRYLEVLTEDIVWFPPGQPALSGRSAFSAWVGPFFRQYAYHFEVINPVVRLAGDWAVERGAFLSRLTPWSGGQPAEHSGFYILLWRREPDGFWRIERYIDETPS